jgi:hypothetical protein
VYIHCSLVSLAKTMPKIIVVKVRSSFEIQEPFAPCRDVPGVTVEAVDSAELCRASGCDGVVLFRSSSFWASGSRRRMSSAILSVLRSVT